MKLAPDCYYCLRRLIDQAAHLATDDDLLRQAAISEAARMLDNEFSYDQLSIAIATDIHKVIIEVTGNSDPYRARKETEMMLARQLHVDLSSQGRVSNRALPARSPESGNHRSDELVRCVKLAAAGNSLDFFRETRAAEEDIRGGVDFEVDDTPQLEARLRGAVTILYLADNAGEVYFDLPLVKLMRRSARVIYAVKPSPVQNDLTLEDVRRSGLEGALGEVMSTGVASPGVVFSLASTRFRREFDSADLIFAKGMGHYEALSELSPQGRVFHCLMAKCKPVADSLGVPMNAYVAMLR
jgi:damage-control phosphatase, subfamily I